MGGVLTLTFEMRTSYLNASWWMVDSCMARIGDQPIERARGIRLLDSVFFDFHCFCVFVIFFFQNFDILSFFVFFDAKIPGGSGRFREVPGGSTFFVAGVLWKKKHWVFLHCWAQSPGRFREVREAKQWSKNGQTIVNHWSIIRTKIDQA